MNRSALLTSSAISPLDFELPRRIRALREERDRPAVTSTLEPGSLEEIWTEAMLNEDGVARPLGFFKVLGSPPPMRTRATVCRVEEDGRLTPLDPASYRILSA